MSATDKKLDELTADLGHQSTKDLTEFYRQVDRFAQLPANPPPGFAVEVVPVICHSARATVTIDGRTPLSFPGKLPEGEAVATARAQRISTGGWRACPEGCGDAHYEGEPVRHNPKWLQARVNDLETALANQATALLRQDERLARWERFSDAVDREVSGKASPVCKRLWQLLKVVQKLNDPPEQRWAEQPDFDAMVEKAKAAVALVGTGVFEKK